MTSLVHKWLLSPATCRAKLSQRTLRFTSSPSRSRQQMRIS
ncbi:uncharacterized protein METZ01_LOCUS55307, partial [marine metagenome]